MGLPIPLLKVSLTSKCAIINHPLTTQIHTTNTVFSGWSQFEAGEQLRPSLVSMRHVSINFSEKDYVLVHLWLHNCSVLLLDTSIFTYV